MQLRASQVTEWQCFQEMAVGAELITCMLVYTDIVRNVRARSESYTSCLSRAHAAPGLQQVLSSSWFRFA